MKSRLSASLFAAALAAVAGLMPGAAVAQAEELPGMCNGRSDAGVVLIAHANGRPGIAPKYILNVTTDETGLPTGTLVLDRGRSRLLVEDWCRVWRHLPGQPTGGCEDEAAGDVEGAATAHAVGTGRLRDGRDVLVRTDVRRTDEGSFFRVRYRLLGSQDHDAEVVAAEDGGCEDEAWTRIPAEGWYPLDQMQLRTPTVAG